MYYRKYILYCLILLILIGCHNTPTEPTIPIFQNAIFVSDINGNDVQKVIDISSCDYVQFIPNSENIIFIKDYSLFITNIHNPIIEQVDIGFDISTFPLSLSSSGEFCYLIGNDNRLTHSNIYEINLVDYSSRNLSNTSGKRVGHFSYKYNHIIYTTITDSDEYTFFRLNLDTSQVDTLISETSTIISSMTFGVSENDILFSLSGDNIENGIYRMDSISGDITNIMNDYWGYYIFVPYNDERLFIDAYEILEVNLNTNNINILTSGWFPDFFGDLMFYSTSYNVESSKIKTYNLINNEITTISDSGMKSKVTKDGSRIVFIGVYEI